MDLYVNKTRVRLEKEIKLLDNFFLFCLQIKKFTYKILFITLKNITQHISFFFLY